MSLPQHPSATGNPSYWIRLVWLSTLPRNLKPLACVMLSFSNNGGGSIFPGIPTLSMCLDIDERSVRRNLRQLLERGVFRAIEERRGEQRRSIPPGTTPHHGAGWFTVYQFEPNSLTKRTPLSGLKRTSARTESGQNPLEKADIRRPVSDQCIDQERRSGALTARSREFQRQQAIREDEARGIVLELSTEARAVLETEVLAELEPWRVRVTAAAFDAIVLEALPAELLRFAHGRPLDLAVAELEAKSGRADRAS